MQYGRLFAQHKQTVTMEQVWLGYFNQTRFTNKWGLWFDAHIRKRDDFFSKYSIAAARLGLTYYINDDTRLTAGYAFFNYFPADNHKEISQPEHRGWQQLQWQTKYKRFSAIQRLRLEERYRRKIASDSALGDGYNFNWRARYSFLLQVPLGKGAPQPNTFSFVANDEVMVNFGRQIVYNYFDQNRFFAGLSYQASPSLSVQFGYMNIFQQQPSGDQYRMVHTGRIFVFQNIDLRK
jgi:long-subunit fatty acid transport protein